MTNNHVRKWRSRCANKMCGVNSMDLVISKTGLMEDLPKHIHINKEQPTRQKDEDSFHTVSGKLEQLGTSLKCLYTNVHSTENK